jgi:superfamily II DNA/RNA helicase
VRNGIVFCNRKSEVDVVAKSLKVHGFDAAPIHGDLDQSLRMKTLANFRSGELKLLVASDVAARGLDIPDVSHVFNYDVPHHADDYVHRIGRTGRAGKTGDTYMIITPADGRSLDKVVKLIGSSPKEETLDLDWSQAEGDEPRRDGRGARSGGRGRAGESRGSGGERSRGRGGEGRGGRERGPRTEREEAAPVEAVADAAVVEQHPEPQAAERPSRDRPPRQRRERGPRRDASPEAAPQAEAREPREPRESREPRETREPRESREQRESREPRETAERPVRGVQRQPEREADDNRVVGFGSDLPAFMRPKS